MPPPTSINRTILIRLVLSLALGLLLACCSAPAADKASPSLDPDHVAKMARGLEIFKKHVRPVLANTCVGCHGGAKTEAELDIADRDSLLKGGVSGPAVVLGKAKDSVLYKRITHAKAPGMPFKQAKLSDDIIARIAEWIDDGAPYDEPLVPGKSTTPWTTRSIPKDAKDFWSFKPLMDAKPPDVKDAAWSRTPLDFFVLNKLETAGIKPNPQAERRLLIRRLYLDLIGLPPTPEEVDAFVADTDCGAYEKLVDRLLASPQYGERWGRRWLDLARFAESHGFEHDYDRPNAFHYRDFVIKALNDDLPYNTFVKWQIAGDEYEPENPQALLATGFLAAGVHSTQITKNEVEKQRYDEMDDMLSTLGTSMLGLTIGCCRCHDHKFDPLPQRDYYRMLATFTTTVRSDFDVNIDPEGYRKAREAFDREHAPFEQALKKFESEELPARLDAWLRAHAADVPPWIILEPESAKSTEGATFTRLADGSYRVGGNNPKFDTYTFEVNTDVTGITAVRLEALADPSLVKGGPGRADNGNFALSDFKVQAAPLDQKDKLTPVKLKNPRATFEQKGLPVAAAIDQDDKSSWAIDPQFGKNHAAVFEVETPVDNKQGTRLVFTLKFNNNDRHAIGRPRLSITTASGPVELLADGVPQSVVQLLSVPAEKLTLEQRARLSGWYRTLDPEWRKLNQASEEHLAKAPRPSTVKALIAGEGLPPVRLHTQGDDFFQETHFLRRGDPNNKEGVATAGFLQVLEASPNVERLWLQPPPSGAKTSFKRHALAEWMTDTKDGAGSLLARVIVNRLWQHHMGRGIVATPSDFGSRGERPSHPELLDYMAHELIDHNWSLKHIHKLIVTSSTYMQSSARDEHKIKADGDNRLCWRFGPRRLEAEVIRDSLLSVSRSLDGRMYGPGTLDESSRRRSIYFTVKRSKLVPMMLVFDAPDGLVGIADRPTTTIAPQALLLLNNPQVRLWARSFARRIGSDDGNKLDDAVGRGYRIALSRPPTDDELTESLKFIRTQLDSYTAAAKTEARELALADFCQVLMCLNEFVYLE